jgi:hypothetical protein
VSPTSCVHWQLAAVLDTPSCYTVTDDRLSAYSGLFAAKQKVLGYANSCDAHRLQLKCHDD